MRAHKKKVVCFTLWFPHHANPRYADLFPRLSSVVYFRKVTLSRQRIVRGLQFRLWNLLSQQVIYPAAIRYFARKYETLFTVSYDQIAAWPHDRSVVVDIDDPLFTREEVTALNLPQVKAIVVTTEKAKLIFEQLGVIRPITVIPQGASLEQIDPHKIQQIRTQYRGDGDVVIGYLAPALTLSFDGPGRPRAGQDDLDFLFAAVQKAREVEPRVKLWLFGTPSVSVKKYTAAIGGGWIQLFGYVPFSDILNYVSNLDIGVYPRTLVQPVARFNAKLAQFMACGIPIVSTNLDESFIIRETHCGIVCDSQDDFSQALVQLGQSAERRAELGNAGRTYAKRNLDWSVLGPTYRDILNGVRHGR